MEKTYLQITSGRGPVECCRVVALVLEKILREAQKRKLRVEILEKETGPVNRTLLSVVVALEGAGSMYWLTNGKGLCCGLPVARIGFITGGRTGLSVCRLSSCPKVVRLPKMISGMKPYGRPGPEGNMSTRQNLP